MKNVWDKIIAEAKQVSLENEERDLLLSQIKTHIASRPIHTPETDTIESPYAYRFRLALSWHEKRFVPAAVILILILFGGTSFAANYALPGETLYSMKVNVNEQVESWMALSPNATARFEAVKAERRLKEVEKLTVKKKKITPKAKAQIKENFSKNAQNVKKIVAEIEASGSPEEAAQVKAEFTGTLEAHAEVLSQLVHENTPTLLAVGLTEKSGSAPATDDITEDIKEIHALLDEQIVDLKSGAPKPESTTKNETENLEVKQKEDVLPEKILETKKLDENKEKEKLDKEINTKTEEKTSTDASKTEKVNAILKDIKSQ